MRKITAILTAIISLSFFMASINAAEFPLIEHSQEREGEITHIVMHFVSNVIANPKNPYDIEDMIEIFRENEVSIHYFVDRDGTIHCAVPESRTAWHAGRGQLADFPHYTNRLNHHSIGIEVLGIGSWNDMEQYMAREEYDALNPDLIGFTEAQYRSLNRLVNGILCRHLGIKADRKHIIGHSEYSSNNKTDPGELFDWSRLDFMNVTK